LRLVDCHVGSLVIVLAQLLDLGAEFIYMISQLVIFRTGQGERLASHNIS
jgi:hypothetical protein